MRQTTFDVPASSGTSHQSAIPASRLLTWGVALSSAWSGTGLYLDGWAHTHELPDTFFTRLTWGHLQWLPAPGSVSGRDFRAKAQASPADAYWLWPLAVWRGSLPRRGHSGSDLAHVPGNRSQSVGRIEPAAPGAGNRWTADRNGSTARGLAHRTARSVNAVGGGALAGPHVEHSHLFHERVPSL